ncbi:MAG: hypothetical protein A4E24_01766 [Methanomethylovorans sp. PtaU1.Bin093]|uniref:hypothetical protein n=1 Tax=Methanomethylovorans sp. PtaU1.Bin093 TaxID=1811679 RepID=UPI0009C7CACB|nr:hypothetical protein [Methanomethylovorans sp. PtaU1.Bin093]OPY18840.1 MAG: hypothetical protein A4E24_01766 [Methanomethylovorans sp. PtaU1.Bin093]
MSTKITKEHAPEEHPPTKTKVTKGIQSSKTEATKEHAPEEHPPAKTKVTNGIQSSKTEATKEHPQRYQNTEDKRYRFISLLEDTRSNFKYIYEKFSKLIDFHEGSSEDNVETAEMLQNDCERCLGEIEENLREALELLEKNPSISNKFENVREVERYRYSINEIFTLYIENSKNEEDKKQIPRLKKCLPYIEESVYKCNMITIPNCLNEQLGHLKSGDALDFYKAYQEEFFSETQKKDLLEYFNRYPESIEGKIDVSKGLIFKVDPKGERWKSYGWIIGTFVAGALGLSLFFWLFKDEIALDNFTIFFKSYLVFIFGALLHILIEGVFKTPESSTRFNFKSASDWLAWVNIKHGAIMVGIVALDLLFILLLLVLGTNGDDLSTIPLLAVGYSSDSLSDTVIPKFKDFIKDKETPLTDRISGT